jgi:tripartite ATP-independent transporter DctP family solute receptor
MLLSLAVFFFAAGGAGQARAAQKPEFELVGGINLDTAHPYYLGMVRFAELMEQKSGGKITMKIFPSAQLGNERDVTEALQLGSVDVTLISAAPLSSFTDDFQIFDFPYIFSNREHAYTVLDGEVGRTILKNLEEHGLIGLELMENGFYWISNNKGIEHPKDMAGIKIRALENQMQVDAYNATGANGIAMAFSEVFTSLQNATLDATGLTPSVIGSQKIYTVQKFLATTDHFYAAAPLLMSKSTYDRMSPELRKVVREAAAEARDYQRDRSKKFDEAKIKEMTDYGTKIIEVDKQEWIDAMVPPTYKKYVGRGKLIDAALYDKVKAMDPMK